MNHTTFNFSSKDGLSLLGRAWISLNEPIKGIIYLFHGLGEHTGRYAHIGEALNEAGYHVVGFDLRGHGLSEGKRGHTPSFNHLLEDMDVFFEKTDARFKNGFPAFLYGHSLGGEMTIEYCLNRKPNLGGVVVTSPWLDLAYKPPELKLAIGKLFNKLMPTLAIDNGLEVEALSRDESIIQAYIDDVYVHNKITARMAHEIFENSQRTLQNATKWNLPLLLMHGTADRITSHKASQQFAEKAGNHVDLVLWEGYYHELHNELENQKIMSKMIQWLDMQSNGKPNH